MSSWSTADDVSRTGYAAADLTRAASVAVRRQRRDAARRAGPRRWTEHRDDQRPHPDHGRQPGARRDAEPGARDDRLPQEPQAVRRHPQHLPGPHLPGRRHVRRARAGAQHGRLGDDDDRRRRPRRRRRRGRPGRPAGRPLRAPHRPGGDPAARRHRHDGGVRRRRRHRAPRGARPVARQRPATTCAGCPSGSPTTTSSRRSDGPVAQRRAAGLPRPRPRLPRARGGPAPDAVGPRRVRRPRDRAQDGRARVLRPHHPRGVRRRRRRLRHLLAGDGGARPRRLRAARDRVGQQRARRQVDPLPRQRGAEAGVAARSWPPRPSSAASGSPSPAPGRTPATSPRARPATGRTG